MDNQKEIRDYNGQEYSVSEGSMLIKELDDRTKCADVQYNSINKIYQKLEPLVKDDLVKVLNGVSIRLSWANKYNGEEATRTTDKLPINSGDNTILVYKLITHISDWDKIKDYSPKIRVERYRLKKKRPNRTIRESGFKYDAHYLKNYENRPSLIPITSQSTIIDMNAEHYFKLDEQYPALSGSKNKRKPYKQPIQFRIELTVGEEVIVSKPLASFKIIASKGNSTFGIGNSITYSLQ